MKCLHLDIEEECWFSAKRLLKYFFILLLLLAIILVFFLLIWLLNCKIVVPVKGIEMIFRPYNEARDECEKQGKSLPYLTTPDKEFDILSEFRSATPKSCKRMFLGNKRVGHYYKSTVSEYTFPSMRDPTNLIMKDPSYRYIYWVTVIDKKIEKGQDNLFTGIDNTTIATDILLMVNDKKGKDDCLTHRFRCVYLYQHHEALLLNALLDIATKILEKEGLEVFGVMPYDQRQNQYPEELNIFNTGGRKVSYVVSAAIKYIFKYDQMQYRSTRFVVTDPDYECLVYERGTNRLLPQPCEDEACVYCI